MIALRAVIVVLIAIALTIVSELFAQKVKDTGADWPMYTRDLAGTRY